MKIHEMNALELQGALETGEVSSVEAVRALIERRDEVDPKLHAFVHRMDDEALSRAADADEARRKGETWGPLHGLPVTVKESIATRGLPSTLGIRKRLAEVQDEDAVVVRLLRKAGGIVIGKTNVPQLLLSHETENPVWGVTRSPWDLSRTPGGSSGGEAAALASGASVLGIGTDIGGSIRVPAAFSGVAGFKPTVDRWSNVRSFTALMGQEVIRGQCGPMARTARDMAFLFRALDGPLHAALDPAVPPLATPDPAVVDLRGLTIGFYDDDGFVTPAASVRRAVREAAALLADCGCRTVEMPPPHATEVVETYYAALSSDGAAVARLALDGEEVTPQLAELRRAAELPALVRRLVAALSERKGDVRSAMILRALGRKPVETYWRLTDRRTRLRREVAAAWRKAGVDAVVCPAHATPALGHRQSGDFTPAGSYSMRYNFLNFPAGVVPVSRVREDEVERAIPHGRRATDRLERKAILVEKGSAGLPLGVQVVALPFEEHTALAVMIALEDRARLRPDFPRTPIDPAAGA